MAFHNIPPNGFPDLPDMEEVEAVVKDVTTLKTSVAGLASDVSNLSSSKANQITIAPFFNAEASYDPGDLVYYNGLSYRCVNAHEGEWDADDFAATTIAGELDALKSGLIDVNSKLNGLHFVQITGTTDLYGQIPFDNGILSKMVGAFVMYDANVDGNMFALYSGMGALRIYAMNNSSTTADTAHFVQNKQVVVNILYYDFS